MRTSRSELYILAIIVLAVTYYVAMGVVAVDKWGEGHKETKVEGTVWYSGDGDNVEVTP